MNAYDRFDLQISEAMADLAQPTLPDYLDDVLGLTARTSQRPAWSFLERWIPMTALADRLRLVPGGSLRPLAVLLILGLLLAAALVALVGSRPQLPPPFGLAANGQLVYADSGELRVIDPASPGSSRPLVEGPRTHSTPAWSLDGTRLAFLRGNEAAKALVVVDANGGRLVELTGEELRDVDAYAPLVWSPDGRWIAVSHTVGGSRAISIVPTDGSRRIRTLELGLEASAPSWHPDSRQLLFRGTASDGEPNLYVVNADGTGVRSLGLSRARLEATSQLRGASWSPDGTRIMYGGLEFLSPEGESRYRTHIVNADGTGDRLIPAPDDVSHVWPRWSPDGRHILFEIVRGEYGAANNELTLGISAADGSDLVEVTSLVETDSIAAVWSPDGASIVAAYWDLGRTYRIDARTGAAVELVMPRTLVGEVSWQRVASDQ